MLHSFYTVQDQTIPVEKLSLENPSQKAHFKILLNAHHTIYQGHFPGNPVVPGVCQIQIIKELTSMVVSHPLDLVKADNVKYLSMINPEVDSELVVQLDIKTVDLLQWEVNASLSNGERTFVKFKGTFLNSKEIHP